MLFVYFVIRLYLILSWHHFVVLLNHSQQNHKLFGYLIQLIPVFFILVTNSSHTLLIKEFLFKLVYLLLVYDMIFIGPEPVDKLLHELFKKNLLLILIILAPIWRWRSVLYLFKGIHHWRLLWLIYDMRIFTPKSDLTRVAWIKLSVLRPKTDPSKPSLVAFSIAFSGNEAEDI
jgi:hypothetical protein